MVCFLPRILPRLVLACREVSFLFSISFAKTITTPSLNVFSVTLHLTSGHSHPTQPNAGFSSRCYTLSAFVPYVASNPIGIIHRVLIPSSFTWRILKVRTSSTLVRHATLESSFQSLRSCVASSFTYLESSLRFSLVVLECLNRLANISAISADSPGRPVQSFLTEDIFKG